MPAPFRLGFLSHLHGSAESRQLYRNYVELFVAAEELGFDSAWVAQHHFSDSAGRLPSPFPFLAAVAERTSRIRLGTAVVTLPLEDPLRVAEDAAVLDALSGDASAGNSSVQAIHRQLAKRQLSLRAERETRRRPIWGRRGLSCSPDSDFSCSIVSSNDMLVWLAEDVQVC